MLADSKASTCAEESGGVLLGDLILKLPRHGSVYPALGGAARAGVRPDGLRSPAM